MLPALETLPLSLAAIAGIAYLFGSIPFGVVITRVLRLGDVRQIGSGNIGATNVLRTGHRGAALATLLLDAGKGAAAVLLARSFAGEDGAQLAALAAFLGHLFPVWLGFRGGKGVATYLGVFLALAWPVGLGLCLIWLLTAALFRYSSLAALVSVAGAPVLLLLFGRAEAFTLALVMAVLVWWRHRANLARLLTGQEPKLGRKSS